MDYSHVAYNPKKVVNGHLFNLIFIILTVTWLCIGFLNLLLLDVSRRIRIFQPT